MTHRFSFKCPQTFFFLSLPFCFFFFFLFFFLPSELYTSHFIFFSECVCMCWFLSSGLLFKLRGAIGLCDVFIIIRLFFLLLFFPPFGLVVDDYSSWWGKSGASFQPVLSFSLSRDKSISQLCIFFFNFQESSNHRSCFLYLI